jgi:hypothetical protein
MSLTDEIAKAKAHNQSVLEKGLHLERPEFSDEDRVIIENFRVYCRAQGVEANLQPTTVAAFMAAAADRDVERTVTAMQAWAGYYHMADPCSSGPVRAVLLRRLRIEPPRSFNKQDRELFACMPVEQKAVLYRREQERDRALRNLQNKHADGVGVRSELRKFLHRSKGTNNQRN